MTKTRLLIVEDDFLIRMTLRAALEDDGFDACEAGDAEEALNRLRVEPTIDILLTDIQLPGARDGHQLIGAARALRPGLPVIVTSGRPGIGGAEAHPGTVFVNKPYAPSQISELARRLVGATASTGPR